MLKKSGRVSFIFVGAPYDKAGAFRRNVFLEATHFGVGLKENQVWRVPSSKTRPHSGIVILLPSIPPVCYHENHDLLMTQKVVLSSSLQPACLASCILDPMEAYSHLICLFRPLFPSSFYPAPLGPRTTKNQREMQKTRQKHTGAGRFGPPSARRSDGWLRWDLRGSTRPSTSRCPARSWRPRSWPSPRLGFSEVRKRKRKVGKGGAGKGGECVSPKGGGGGQGGLSFSFWGGSFGVLLNTTKREGFVSPEGGGGQEEILAPFWGVSVLKRTS